MEVRFIGSSPPRGVLPCLSGLVALTSVEFGIDGKLNYATTKPVGQFVNVLDRVLKTNRNSVLYREGKQRVVS